MPKKQKAICLVSGGMDSALTLAIALEDYDVSAMHAYYGQLTQDREIKAFRDIASHYGINEIMTFSLGHLTQIGGSALTDPDITIHTGGLDKTQIPNTYVPFRNAHLLSAAVSWAEVISASAIFIGAIEEDSSGYPDCRESFINAFNIAIDEGTRPETNLNVITPVMHLTKAEIVERGMELNVPFELTWSCYKNIDKACGVCDSCILRLKAFDTAGFDDPIPYIEGQ